MCATRPRCVLRKSGLIKECALAQHRNTPTPTLFPDLSLQQDKCVRGFSRRPPPGIRSKSSCGHDKILKLEQKSELISVQTKGQWLDQTVRDATQLRTRHQAAGARSSGQPCIARRFVLYRGVCVIRLFGEVEGLALTYLGTPIHSRR